MVARLTPSSRAMEETVLSGLVLGVRLVLAAVFAVAGVAKLLDAAGSRGALEGFGVPRGAARLAGTVLPVAELAIAAGLLVPASAWWSALAAAGLLARRPGGCTGSCCPTRCGSWAATTPTPGGQEDRAEALRLYRELLPGRVRILGRDHPDTLTTRSNIAASTGEAGEPRGGPAAVPGAAARPGADPGPRPPRHPGHP